MFAEAAFDLDLDFLLSNGQPFGVWLVGVRDWHGCPRDFVQPAEVERVRRLRLHKHQPVAVGQPVGGRPA